MSSTIDDLGAVRIIYDALIQLDEPTRERVLRWVNEKLGTTHPSQGAGNSGALVSPSGSKKPAGRPKKVAEGSPAKNSLTNESQAASVSGSAGLREYLAYVQPKTANLIIAATAKYFQQAQPPERRTNIDSSDVEAAYTVMNKNVPTYIGQLLITAKNGGYVRSVERGKYSLTIVGDEMLSEASAGRSELSSNINQ